MTAPRPYFDPTRFGAALAAVNGLNEKGFDRWEFLPGMRFMDRERWWGAGGLRATPHEGVDLCLFSDARGRLHRIQGTVRIPAMFDGVVVRTVNDFLGRSVFFRHECFDARGRMLHTVFGHTRPCRVLRGGMPVRQGEIFAEVARPKNKGMNILAHLHITAAWVPASMTASDLDWEALGRSPHISLVDPLTARF